MVFPLIKRICEYTWKNYKGEEYLFYATTNGTVLNDELKRWFVEHRKRFVLGLSLDGTADTQNKNRSDSFSKIDISFFRENWPFQDVKMTLSKYSLENLAENISFLHEQGFNICGSNFAEGDIDWSDKELLPILARELKKVVAYYFEHPDIKVCQLFEKNLAFCEAKREIRKKYCGIGTGAVFFDIDGNKYPCPFITPMTFSSEKIVEIKKIDFSDDENFIDEDCFKNCYLFPICPTCSGNNYKQCNSFKIRDRGKCDLFKLTVLFIADLQARKIANGTDGMDEETKYWTIESIKKIRKLYLQDFQKI